MAGLPSRQSVARCGCIKPKLNGHSPDCKLHPENRPKPKVSLRGGPFHGQTLEVETFREPLILSGGDVPEGKVARYRPTREKGVYRFREYDRIVGTLPMPGEET